MKKLAIASLLSIGLANCATMSKDDCLTADWERVGYQDGTRGHTASRVESHAKACSKHGISPDLDLYRKGRAEGLKEYCRPDNGFREGLAGRDYRGVCPEDMRDDFLYAWQDGQTVYKARRRVEKLRDFISSHLSELHEIKELIDEKKAWLVEAQGTPSERAKVLEEIEDLSNEVGRIHSDINQAEFDLVDAQRELEDVEDDLLHRWGR